MGGVVLVAADTAVGKSLLLYRLLACCTALTPFAPGVDVALDRPLKAILFNGEGSMKFDIQPRLSAAGVTDVVVIDCVVDRPDIRLSDIPAIAAEHGADVIAIDPLTQFVRGSLDSFQVRVLLQPFHALDEKGVTTLIMHHHVKSRTARAPLGLISGSKAWVDNVPTVFQIVPCNSEGDAILEVTKGRAMSRPWPAYEFWVEQSEDDGQPIAVIGEPSTLRIADLLEVRRPNTLPPKLAQAVQWFRDYLKHGPRDALPAEPATYERIGITRATFRRAKRAAGVKSRPKPNGGRGYEWYIDASASWDGGDCHSDSSADSPTREQKLQALRDHPTTPPEEAAAAQAALDRMQGAA